MSMKFQTHPLPIIFLPQATQLIYSCNLHNGQLNTRIWHMTWKKKKKNKKQNLTRKSKKSKQLNNNNNNNKKNDNSFPFILVI